MIGFRVRDEAAFSPIADAFTDVAALAVELAKTPEPPELHAGSANDVAVLLLQDSVLPKLGVPPRPDLSFVGRQLTGISSIAFDHAAGTITISSANVNTVDRLVAALAAAPPLPALPPPSGQRPEHMNESPPQPAFAKQLSRMERRLALGGLDRLALARMFTAPTRGADMFEVYRALKLAAPARHHFFVELVSSPIFGGYTVAAAAPEMVRLSASSGAEALAESLLAALPIGALCGAPLQDALAVWRDVATTPFGMRGGAFARVRPGGAIELMRASAYVVLEDAQLSTAGVAEVVAGRTVESHTEAAAEDVAPALAAIRHVHDIVASREAEAAATTGESTGSA